MTDILTQDEIDQLLSAISSGDATQEDFHPSTRDHKKVRIYDFKRPAFLTKPQLNILEIVFKEYARELSIFFTEKLNTNISVYLNFLDQYSFDEFKRSIGDPSFITTLYADPLPGNMFTAISHKGALKLLTLYRKLETNDIENPSNIEELESFLIPMHTGVFRAAFGELIDIRNRVCKSFTDPFDLNTISQETMCLQASLSFEITKEEYTIDICIPRTTLAKLIPKLTIYHYSQPKDIREFHLDNIDIPATIRFKDSVNMSLEQANALKPGDYFILPSKQIELAI